jgi:hypothetical protein
MTDSAAVDILQFGNELVRRRNKAALVLTPDLREERGYAAQLATATGALHLDLLDYFEVHEDLSLVTFSLEELCSLIARQKPARLLVLSGLEFILGAWFSQGEPGQVKESLCRRVELWEGPAFLLVTQDDPEFAAYQPTRFRGGQVVVKPLAFL